MSDARPGVERLVLPAQFGVRLLDSATGRAVSDGLQVRLWPSGRAGRTVAAVANHAGVFVAHPLPAPDPPERWVVEVVDTQGRFLPLRFGTGLPSDTLHDVVLLSPPFDADLPRGGVTLFSAPTRRLPPGMAALSADLRDIAGQPAAWAVAEAQLTGRNGDPGPTLGWGMADRRGSLFVPIQAPRVRGALAATPDPSWSVRLTVRYGAPADALVPEIPAWDEALRQPDVMLLSTLSPMELLDDLHVQAGHTLVVCTAGRSELVFSQ